jgi:hypothetical protein
VVTRGLKNVVRDWTFEFLILVDVHRLDLDYAHCPVVRSFIKQVRVAHYFSNVIAKGVFAIL